MAIKKKNKKPIVQPELNYDLDWKEFYRDHVAGLQYYGHQLASVQAGDEVKLIHEPANPHSPHAVAVCVNDVKIGHVKDNAARFMVGHRKNYKWRAHVISYNPSNPTWQMCVILIEHATLPPEPKSLDPVEFN